MKMAVEVQQVRVERRVSYAEAVRVVQVQGDTGSRERWVGASRLGIMGQVGSDMGGCHLHEAKTSLQDAKQRY
jgi:hypothetical protein